MNDNTRTGVQGVRIDILNGDRVYTATTDLDGNYSIPVQDSFFFHRKGPQLLSPYDSAKGSGQTYQHSSGGFEIWVDFMQFSFKHSSNRE